MSNEAVKRVQGSRIYHQGDLREKHSPEHSPKRIYEALPNHNNRLYKGTKTLFLKNFVGFVESAI